jgi:multidrug efflux pump subunit AcrA (membrane-fusion protein)
VDAWTPVPWPADAAQAPLSGELRPLAENFHAFLRSEAATAPSSASERLAQLEAQAGAFEDWYRRRWNGESPPGSGSIAQRRQALAAERAAAEEAARRAAAEAARKADEERRRAEEAARKALEAQLAWTARRRDLLEEAEALLASLPPPTQTSAEQERDRVALKAFIASMDTPLGGVPRPAPATPAPASNAPASTPSASPSPPSPPPGTPPR